jgi:hypothetical protein
MIAFQFHCMSSFLWAQMLLLCTVPITSAKCDERMNDLTDVATLLNGAKSLLLHLAVPLLEDRRLERSMCCERGASRSPRSETKAATSLHESLK